MRKTWLFLYLGWVLILSPIISLFLFPLADVAAAPLSKLQVANFSATPDPFSPNGDGRLDVVTITSVLNIEGTGQTANTVLNGELAVQDSSGHRVIGLAVGKPLSLAIGKLNEVNFSTEWDGKTSSGEIVADGTYFYTVDLSLLQGCKGNGDNRDDQHSGHIDLLGDCNSGEGNDDKGERIITTSGPYSGEITIDNTPPTITIEGAANGEFTNKVVTPVISIFDRHMASQSIFLNNQPFLSGTPVKEEGQYVLSVVARDKAENIASRSLTFTIDKTPPNIEVLPLEGALLDRSPAEITIKYSDLLSGIEPSEAVFTLNGVDISGSVIFNDASATYTPGVLLPDGEYRVELTISDKAGNEAKKEFGFTVDSTPPVVNIVSPEEGATIDNSSPEIRIKFSDSLSGVDLSSISLSVSDIDVTHLASISENFLTYVPNPPLADGTHSLSISVSDKTGNSKEKSINFLTRTKRRPYIFPEPGFKYGAYQAPETADINNDGVLDLVILYEGSTTRVAVMMGKGDGSFKSPTNIIEVNDDDADKANLALDDFNGDGYIDIVLFNVYNRYLWLYEPENGKPRLEIQVFINNKNGSFYSENKYIHDDLAYQADVKIITGDFNKDNYKDATVVSGNGKVFTFLGNVTGSLSNPIESFVCDPLYSYYNYMITGVVSLELNSDKTTDIAIAYENRLFFLIASGDGTFKPTLIEDANNIGFLYFDAMDIDDDGNIDIVFADEHLNSYRGEIFSYSVLLGDGNGGIREKKRSSFGLEISYYGLIFLEEVTGDNIVDLLIINQMQDYSANNGEIYVLKGNGDGTFDGKSPIIIDTSLNGTAMTFADTDKDGFIDILVSSMHEASTIYTLFGKGDGNFFCRKAIHDSYGVNNGGVSGGVRGGVISADFDNDKTPDLAFVGDGSEGVIFSTILNRGSAWTGNLFKYGSSNRVGDGPSSVKVGDFNGDGKPDVVTTNYLSSDVSVLINNNGSFEMPVTYPVGENPSFVNVEDMNKDGYLDLIVTSESLVNLTILFGSGNGTFPVKKEFNNSKCDSKFD